MSRGLHGHHIGDIAGGHHLDSDSGKSGIPIPPSKPKIWSLADTAVCKTPPPQQQPNTLGSGLPHHQQHLGQPQYGMPTPSPWGGFSQFDPSVVRPSAMSAALRTNMFGMSHMAGMAAAGLSHHGLGGMMGAAATLPPPMPPTVSSGVALPASSPSVSALSGNSELQADTPPHTPPTGGGGSAGQQSKQHGFGSYNGGSSGLQNGFNSSSSQLSPNVAPSVSSASSSAASSSAAAESKLLSFHGGLNASSNSSFKMM